MTFTLIDVLQMNVCVKVTLSKRSPMLCSRVIFLHFYILYILNNVLFKVFLSLSRPSLPLLKYLEGTDYVLK